jgi:hypothetical protein
MAALARVEDRGRAPARARARLLLGFGLGLGLGGCQQTLVDGSAPGSLVNPSCRPAQAVCGGACTDEDAGHCGPSCADCTGQPLADPNAVPACQARACGMACQPGFLRSGSTCQRATAVTAGFAHSCALLADGAVACWGANEHGQLGDGTTADRSTPALALLPGPASAVAAGYVHTCAAVAGLAYCWGDDSVGELGTASRADPTRPAQVPGIEGVTALAAGGGENAGTPTAYYGHTCALVGGSAWCWGADESGQLGDGAFQVARPAPAPVPGLGTGVTALAAGDRHTCAVASGAVLCWGAGAAGQLGDGGSGNAAAPRLAIASGASAVAAGASHSCAVTGPPGAEGLSCWGDNGSGQVALGVSTPAVQPTALALDLGSLHPTGVAAGGADTCAFTADAPGPLCFGSNAQGELGLAATPRGKNALSLAAVQGLAAGFQHECALLGDGAVRCWGANDRGQVGNGAAGGLVTAPADVSGR